MKAKLLSRREAAEGTLSFTIQPEAEVEFTAGQNFDLRLLDAPHPDDKENTRTLSAASSPRSPTILFATRLTGSGFKRSLLEVPVGTELELDGPYGSFTLDGDIARPAVFLAGGIGITPFRAMIEDAVERKAGRRLTLLYSNRCASGTPFIDDLEGWARASADFRLVAILTSPQAGEPWTGETGRIDEGFLRRFLPGNEKAVWYVAGPDGFVRAMLDDLLPGVGIAPEDVRAEEFAGY